MQRRTKIVLGIVSVLPLAYMFVFIAAMAGFVFIGFGESHNASAPLAFKIVMAVHLAVMAIMFALMIFYVVYLFRMTRQTEAQKILWALFLFIGNIIAFPVFFYLYIWREAEPAAV